MRRPRRVFSNTELCVGFVVIPQHGALETTRSRLAADGRFELGPATNGRLPGCFFAAAGHDEEVLADLESLDSVLKVEVVYAEDVSEGK